MHWPRCPSATAPAAAVIVSCPEEGWSLFCNGVVAFDDAGAITPEGFTISPNPLEQSC
jgi:hypothetical protein